MRRRLLEPIDVDLGREDEHAVARLDRAGVEGAPRHVHRLVQVVRGRGRAAVAPEHVHRLLAMEPVVAGEREQLHQLARLLQPPGRVGHLDPVDGGRKPAEERQTNIAHRGNQCRPLGVNKGIAAGDLRARRLPPVPKDAAKSAQRAPLVA